MLDYTIRRLILLVPTLIAGSMVLFFSMQLLPPRDAIDLQFPGANIEEEEEAKAKLRELYGLDRPLFIQYLDWAKGFVTGDWGVSLHSRRPISDELKHRIPVSMELSLIGLVFTWVISFPLGIVSAVWQDRAPDYVLRTTAYALDAVPSFLVGILLLTYLAVEYRWAPPTSFSHLWDDPMRHIRIMLLPTLVVGVGAVGSLIRFTRTFMLEVLREDYIRTARAKGLSERAVLFRHAMRNVSLPFITVLGAQVPALLTSSVIIENLFSLPGMGRYTVAAAVQLDYPVVMTTTMFFAVIILVTQLITDLSYAWADPRVSYGR
ncbi:MAG TPA: ABC transporter permease [Dehalococcoidia bacterium]